MLFLATGTLKTIPDDDGELLMQQQQHMKQHNPMKPTKIKIPMNANCSGPPFLQMK
jgi:hypothetical protein